MLEHRIVNKEEKHRRIIRGPYSSIGGYTIQVMAAR